MEQFLGYPLDQLALKYSAVSLDSFIARFPAPALVIETDEKNMLPRTFDTHEGTVLTSGNAPNAPGSGTQFAQFLKKSDRNAMADKITVGRSNNNDVLIVHSSVSKFHSYFFFKNESWLLADMGSTNGTFVNGVQVFEGSPAGVKTGVVIRLGGVAAYFFTPKGLFDYLGIYKRMRGLKWSG